MTANKKEEKGPLKKLVPLVLWFTVIEMSLRVSFLPVNLGVTPDNIIYITAQDNLHLFVLNGLPILMFWYATQYLPYRGLIMFVMLFVMDVFYCASIGKVLVLQSAVVYTDLFKLMEGVRVMSAGNEKLTAAEYLRFVNLLVPLLTWRYMERKPLQLGFLKKAGSRKPFELAGAVVFCAALICYVSFMAPKVFGAEEAGIFQTADAGASSYSKTKVIDPADPVLWDKKNLAYFTADPMYHLKDFGSYGPICSFIMSVKEYYAIRKQLDANAPDEGTVRNALEYLSSAKRTGYVPAAPGVKTRPNVIVVLEEAMGRAAFESPKLLGADRVVVPFMKSLEDELVFTDAAFSPVLGWETPQSEFMVLCSAFPDGVLDKYGIVYTNHMDHDYVSLASVLRRNGYYTAVFHANWRNFWLRENAYRRLGFDSYYSNDDFEEGEMVGIGLSDRDFLRQVSEKLRGLPEPYFAFVITLSGHAPFNLPDLEKNGVTDGLTGIDPYAVNYFEAMNYADRALKTFWDETADIRENGIMVIFGDHQGLVTVDQYRSVGYKIADNDTALRHQVPLVISARHMEGGMKPARGAVADLADVAPTVLDMLDIKAPDCFVGSSLFAGKTVAMDAVGDVMDDKRICNYYTNHYYDYVAKRAITRNDCEDLLRWSDAARVISADVIWGNRYSYRR